MPTPCRHGRARIPATFFQRSVHQGWCVSASTGRSLPQALANLQHAADSSGPRGPQTGVRPSDSDPPLPRPGPVQQTRRERRGSPGPRRHQDSRGAALLRAPPAGRVGELLPQRQCDLGTDLERLAGQLLDLRTECVWHSHRRYAQRLLLSLHGLSRPLSDVTLCSR